MSKKCHRCKKALPEENFAPRPSGIGLRSVCMACRSRTEKKARADVANTIMPVVFELLTQYGPMRASIIVELLKQQQPKLNMSNQLLLHSLPLWEHAQSISVDIGSERVIVYRIVGDTRPVYKPAKQQPPESAVRKRHPVDDAEMDAWFNSLKAEVAQREAMRHVLRGRCRE